MVTISGTSGALSRSTIVSLTVAAIVVIPPSAVPVPVNMGAAFNVYGIVNDPGESDDGGLDGNGYAYSAKLLGPSISAMGVAFKLGAPSTQNAASRTYIALPAGNFASLKLLGAAVNGNQMNQPFLVTYTDGTTSTFTQSVSDWGRPQNYPGENQAATTSYRLDDDGRRDVAPYLVYGYSFLLNSSKTVRSLTLPNNRNVTVLAITLVPASAGTVNRDFDLMATPAALNLQPGRTATSHIAISAINGFTGAVTFSASGLPSGVSATFSPASSTGASTVTFTATSAAARGTATVTIVGTSGALRHTDTIALTVAGPVMVSLTSAFNVTGILSEGNERVTGGLDGYGHYYSSKLLGDSLTAGGVPFDLGDPGRANATTKTTISLPSGSFTSLKFLGTAVNGKQENQVFLVTYTDGTTNTFHQSMSEWTRSQDYPGEDVASSMPYRLAWWGIQYQTSRLYNYSFNLNNTKKVKSLTLPSNRNVTVLAITLQ